MDNEHIQKQYETAQRQLFEEKERNKSIELVECDLLHKLQSKDAELNDFRSLIADLEEKVSIKSEAIEKAHKVIQRLNEEMERNG